MMPAIAQVVATWIGAAASGSVQRGLPRSPAAGGELAGLQGVEVETDSTVQWGTSLRTLGCGGEDRP